MTLEQQKKHQLHTIYAAVHQVFLLKVLYTHC